MYNRRYEKVFLMLRQETAGYGTGKRPPWGSCVMELKNGRGRLQLTIQGLKAGSYEVYAMAGEETIFCGLVQPQGKEGRCGLKWDFDPDKLGSGRTAEELHTVLVMAEGLAAPLTAYFKGKQDWKKDFKRRERAEILLEAAEMLEGMEKREAPKARIDYSEGGKGAEEYEAEEKRERNGSEAAAEERKERNINGAIAEEQKESYHGSFQGLLAKFRRELEELEEAGILSPKETEAIRSSGEPPRCVQEKTEQGLFAAHRETSPFGDGIPWKCLTPDELSLLAEIPLHWRQEFFFLLPGRKYHHLILQEKEEGIYLGLPSYYREEDAKEGERFGFREFRPVEGDRGYWMCFLERKK
ncbi:MAG: hypothetical protein Q4C06_01325 [Bacillota bacterium]|nr:hypothetical protein [Bacillota bacterium]